MGWELGRGTGYTTLTRRKQQYFVDGKPVTIKKSLQWVARCNRDLDGGGGICDEQARFYALCARLMK